MVPELERLSTGHAEAVLAFELANRAYFARFISDRGEAYFQHFTARHDAMLTEQAAGLGAFHVLIDEDGSVLGRFNLTFGEAATAELGYRVAEHATGRGLATRTVQDMSRLVRERYDLRTLRAATSQRNVPSQRVLVKAGFVRVGPADPAAIGGKTGSWYELDLSAD